jgi:hypothetical protein
MRRLLLTAAFLVSGFAQTAHAQLAAPEASSGVLGCLQVTPAVMKAHEKSSARCPASCTGCGCNGGPGYKDAKGCVGFKDIIRRCGQAPHKDCKAVCRMVQPACFAYGRAWLAANEKALNLVLSWTPAPVDVDDKDSGSDVPLREPDVPLQSDQVDAAAEFRCGEKHTCGEMSSCDEAKFHLTQCGLHRLDGTKTGVPCKAICGH